MPIDPDVAIGADLGRTFTWSASDVLLYHLGIGAGSRAGDNLTPTRCATPSTARPAGAAVLRRRRADLPRDRPAAPRPAGLRHQPGPGRARLASRSRSTLRCRPRARPPSARRISDIWDKGKAAVIWQEGVATSASGEALWTVRSSIFVKGEGGWGGDRGTSEPVELPDRAPDADTTYDVTPQQALLYRLCGDRNPLHADPAFAGARLPGADPARPVLLRHRAARAHRRLLGGDATAVARLLGEVRRGGLPGRDDPCAGLARGRTDRRLRDVAGRRRARRRAGARRRRPHPRRVVTSAR